MPEPAETRGEPSPREIELKLRIPPDQVARLMRHSLLQRMAATKPVEKRLISTYFDTDDLRLMKNQVALRVRRDGKRRIQTVKGAVDAKEGPLARAEWEHEVEGDHPDLSRIGSGPLRKLLWHDKVRTHLKPLFVTDVKRRVWPVRLRGATVEVAIDVGEIKSDRGRVPICEAELELKSGRIDSVFRLARALHKSIPFVVETRSKAERGYELVADARPRPRKAAPLDIGRAASIGEAWLAIGRNCFHQLRANEAAVGALGAADAEGVHQLRVSVRRLRSALTAFKPVVPRVERERVTVDLRWMAQRCGPARDWDVFGEDLLAPLRERMPEEPALGALGDAVAAARDGAYEQVTAMLADTRYTDQVLALEAWWEAAVAAKTTAEAMKQPAIGLAANVLKRMHARLHQQGDRIDKLGESELHELRIRAKKLRYAAEFFRGPFDPREARAYGSALTGIQDRLGSLNDATVARQLLATLEANDRVDKVLLARAAGIVTGWNLARIEADLKKLPKAWEQFCETRPFWK